jgi:anti-anti-sigma regulatory factor
MGPDEVWCRLTLTGPAPDIAAVGALARIVLAARDAGGRLDVRDLSPALRELLELAGLLGEVVRQPEDREDPLGVEEGVEAGDAPV